MCRGAGDGTGFTRRRRDADAFAQAFDLENDFVKRLCTVADVHLLRCLGESGRRHSNIVRAGCECGREATFDIGDRRQRRRTRFAGPNDGHAGTDERRAARIHQRVPNDTQ